MDMVHVLIAAEFFILRPQPLEYYNAGMLLLGYMDVMDVIVQCFVHYGVVL